LLPGDFLLVSLMAIRSMVLTPSSKSSCLQLCRVLPSSSLRHMHSFCCPLWHCQYGFIVFLAPLSSYGYCALFPLLMLGVAYTVLH
jgi:hypothetical protein